LGEKNSVEFTLAYNFQIKAVPSELKFIAPIPRTTPGRQEILDIKYSPEPARVFDKDGTKYAEFIFRKPPNELRLEMNIKATLFRFDLVAAKKRQGQPVENLADPNTFLKSEKYIEGDSPRIQQAAKAITTTPNQTALVNAIYEYVTDNVSYLIQKQELGALQTLEKRQGACTEYSDLFVALCRAKGIPARVVKGYVSEPVYLPQHAWAEVYLNEYGWVPFDPTYGDVPDKTIRNRNFENLKPIYVYLSHVRNDPILDTAITTSGFSVGDVTVEHTVEFK
jgi:transglutaminase-like putative cysteine protease